MNLYGKIICVFIFALTLLAVWRFAIFLSEESELGVQQDRSGGAARVATQVDVMEPKRSFEVENFQVAWERNLFDVSREEKIAEGAQPQPQTQDPNLRLTLAGILQNRNESLSAAVILGVPSTDGKKLQSNLYRQGQMIADTGFLLKRVHSNHVVLERGGREVVLQMQRNVAPPSAPAAVRQPPAPPNLPPVPPNLASEKPPTLNVEEPQDSTERQRQIDEIRRDLEEARRRSREERERAGTD